MKIALFINHKPQALELAKHAADLIQDRAQIFVKSSKPIENESSLIDKTPVLTKKDIETLDLVIAFGGDGTILSLLRTYPNLETPVMGVNVGRLGFMTDVTASEMENKIECFFSKQYTLEQRLMIEGSYQDKAVDALNEIVFHRGNSFNLIDLAVHVDGHYLNTFSADGLIIATPNGSTAYSLAAGGPILVPYLQALVMTPISPHTISNRPLVLMPSDTISVENLSRFDVEVSLDGSVFFKIQSKEMIFIKKSTRMFHSVQFPDNNYFQTLRTKLRWVGQARFGKE